MSRASWAMPTLKESIPFQSGIPLVFRLKDSEIHKGSENTANVPAVIKGVHSKAFSRSRMKYQATVTGKVATKMKIGRCSSRVMGRFRNKIICITDEIMLAQSWRK